MAAITPFWIHSSVRRSVSIATTVLSLTCFRFSTSATSGQASASRHTKASTLGFPRSRISMVLSKAARGFPLMSITSTILIWGKRSNIDWYPRRRSRRLICSGMVNTTTLPLFCICLAAISAPILPAS